MGRKDGMFTVQFIYSVCSAGVKNIKLPVPSQSLCLTTNKCKIGFDHAIIFNFKSIFSSDTKMIRATRYFCISRYLKIQTPQQWLPNRLSTYQATYHATYLPGRCYHATYPTLPYPTLPCSTPPHPPHPTPLTHPPTHPTHPPHPTPPRPTTPPYPTLINTSKEKQPAFFSSAIFFKSRKDTKNSIKEKSVWA